MTEWLLLFYSEKYNNEEKRLKIKYMVNPVKTIDTMTSFKPEMSHP